MSPAESPRWSKRRWLYSILGLVATQAGIIFWVGQPGPPPQERPIFRTILRLVVDPQDTERIAELTEHEDPTLLALPTFQGFSGPAWLAFTPPDYQPGDPAEPPHWLALRESSFGATFAALLATSAIAPPLVADKPVPRLPRIYEPNRPPDPVTSRSRLRVEAALAARPILEPVDLPPWPSSYLLSNSVVQAGVDADGVTVFTALLSQSGSRDADSHALGVASRSRFQAISRPPGTAPSEDLTWGRLIFQWHTLPLPLTNPGSILP